MTKNEIRQTFRDMVSALRKAYKAMDEASNHVDHLKALAPGMSLAEHVHIAKALRATRDLASKFKASLTTGTIDADEHFALRIAEEVGDVTITVANTVYRATAKVFASAPSQIKEPEKFKELVAWLEANGHGDRVDLDEEGHYTIAGLSEICETALEAGQPTPPHVKTHMVDSIRVSEKRS
jgi:hypothetical protein